MPTLAKSQFHEEAVEKHVIDEEQWKCSAFAGWFKEDASAANEKESILSHKSNGKMYISYIGPFGMNVRKTFLKIVED
jgi:hypothetical protein